jgi:hypothetical protein
VMAAFALGELELDRHCIAFDNVPFLGQYDFDACPFSRFKRSLGRLCRGGLWRRLGILHVIMLRSRCHRYYRRDYDSDYESSGTHSGFPFCAVIAS